MTITVSVSQFRQNISDYLMQAQAGHTIILRDDKKKRDIAQVVGKKQFNPQRFWATMKRVSGTFSAKDHPEWATPQKISQWLHKTRKAGERHF